MKLNERIFNVIRTLLVAAVALTLTQPALAAESTKPNIIVILVDDLGYADLGCQGSKEVRSPRIDSLAANGVRCTAGYVTAPMCSPSTQAPERADILNIGGFSDAVFNVVASYLGDDAGRFVAEVESIEL